MLWHFILYAIPGRLANAKRYYLMALDVDPTDEKARCNLGSLYLRQRRVKDAMNEAMRYWSSTSSDTFYVIGTVSGPHPYPEMVRDLQRVIGDGILPKPRGLPALFKQPLWITHIVIAQIAAAKVRCVIQRVTQQFLSALWQPSSGINRNIGVTIFYGAQPTATRARHADLLRR